MGLASLVPAYSRKRHAVSVRRAAGFVRLRALGGFLLVAALVVAGGMGYRALFVRDATPGIELVSTGPTVSQIEKLKELVTLRVHVADVLTGRDEKWYGNVESVHLIKGDALLSVDLSEAKVVSANAQRKEAVVCLPPPRVFEARVDHERSRRWSVRRGFLVIGTERADSITDAVYRQGQRLIESVASQEEWVDQARRQAEAAISQFYSALGWQVAVTWQDRAPTTAPETAPSP